MAELGSLLSEGAKLKARIDADKARLAEVNRAIEALCEFPEGKSTAHVAANGFRATVTRKTTVKWDQKKLAEAMKAIGAESFQKVFTYEFKPVGKRQLDAFLEFGAEGEVEAVKAAMTVAPASPSVKIEEAMADGAC